MCSFVPICLNLLLPLGLLKHGKAGTLIKIDHNILKFSRLSHVKSIQFHDSQVTLHAIRTHELSSLKGDT